MNKLDSNPYLLCFNNCVIDFKNKYLEKGNLMIIYQKVY